MVKSVFYFALGIALAIVALVIIALVVTNITGDDTEPAPSPTATPSADTARDLEIVTLLRKDAIPAILEPGVPSRGRGQRADDRRRAGAGCIHWRGLPGVLRQHAQQARDSQRRGGQRAPRRHLVTALLLGHSLCPRLRRRDPDLRRVRQAGDERAGDVRPPDGTPCGATLRGTPFRATTWAQGWSLSHPPTPPGAGGRSCTPTLWRWTRAGGTPTTTTLPTT